MRVCFVMAGLPHYFKLVLNKLASDYQIDLTLIKPQSQSAALGAGVKEDNEGAGYSIIELPEYTTWYGKAFFRELLPTLERIQPDIVVMSAWPYFLYFVLNPFFYGRFRRLKAKLICRDIPFNVAEWGKVASYYYSNKNRTEDFRTSSKSLGGLLVFWAVSFLRRLYLPLADAHINYIDEARTIIGSYGVPQERIFVAANSPDTDQLLAAYSKVLQLPPILPTNPHRLIHVGRLVKWKRVDLIMQAVNDLSAEFEQIELVVIGYGPEEQSLRQRAEEMGISEHVRFVGGVYDSVTLGQYLHASAIYVLGGMGGLSINDAMCFAKPVVCSEADGTERRLVKEGVNGMYFENGDADSLKNCLRELLAQPDKIATFGQNSLRIIREEVNIHTVLAEYVRAFRYVFPPR